MIETFFCTARDGAATAARLSGTPRSALAFVHGVGSTAAIWDYQLTALRDRARCMAIELRGNGVPKPEPEPALITREGYANDVLAVADAQGVGSFTIVGCSLGGVVAFELWKRAPKRIEAMVIVGSFASYPNARAYADSVKAAVKEAEGMPAFARSRAAKLGLPPDRMRETIEQMSCKTVPSYLAATDATWTGDYTNVLPTIDVPVLVAAGERDAIAPFALSQVIASSIPGAELEAIPDAGHVANADNPAYFNTMLARFFDRVAAAR